MQTVAYDTLSTLADISEHSAILKITDRDGMRLYTIEFDGGNCSERRTPTSGESGDD